MQSETQQQIPHNWPHDVQYLPDQIYSAAVTEDMHASLSRRQDDLEKVAASRLPSPYTWLSIDCIKTAAHPAFRQQGLFAMQDLGPSTLICLYLGYVHTDMKNDTDPCSDYDVVFDRDLKLSIDARKCGNEARMVNDYRGIAASPNAEFRDCLVSVPCSKRASGVKWERRLGIFVLPAGTKSTGIRAGEEILISYGKGYWDSRAT